MKIEQALQALREGKKVKDRKRDIVYFIDGGELCMDWQLQTRTIVTRGISLSLRADDILADDWEVIQ